LGQKRIGLAISRGKIAFKYQTLAVSDLDSAIGQILKICQQEKVGKIVVGLAKNKQQQAGFEAKKQMEFTAELEKKAKLPVVLENEFLTSREAERLLREQNISARKISQNIDSTAAQIILQSYLDREN